MNCEFEDHHYKTFKKGYEINNDCHFKISKKTNMESDIVNFMENEKLFWISNKMNDFIKQKDLNEKIEFANLKNLNFEFDPMKSFFNGDFENKNVKLTNNFYDLNTQDQVFNLTIDNYEDNSYLNLLSKTDNSVNTLFLKDMEIENDSSSFFENEKMLYLELEDFLYSKVDKEDLDDNNKNIFNDVNFDLYSEDVANGIEYQNEYQDNEKKKCEGFFPEDFVNLHETKIYEHESKMNNFDNDIKKEIKKRSRKNQTNKISENGQFQINEKNKIKLSISNDSSTVACLTCVIHYHDYKGIITNVLKNDPHLINTYYVQNKNSHLPKSIKYLYMTKPNEILSSSCVNQRIKYDRDISELHGSVSNIVYKSSSIYSLELPYEPQHYRFELNKNKELINESKCGLCPYCEKIKFLPFKNSSYLSHLTLEHGIFSNNFLTPEGLYFGRYSICKNEKYNKHDKKQSKYREIDGILCAHCWKVIELSCWSMKSNKLLSYFRHFKNYHSNDTTKPEMCMQLPQIKTRGRILYTLD